MQVNSAVATAPAAQSSAASASTASGAGSTIATKDMFLKLLVAQMKYQDPLNPSDPTKMTSQLSQFNMVEQQVNTNKLLTDFLAQQQTASNKDQTAAASYLGHTVSFDGSQINYSGKPQDFTLNMPADASQVQAVIVDANGNVVRHMSWNAMFAGPNNVTWDGLSDSGANLANGNYQIQAVAIDAYGQPITPSVSTIGVVQAVRLSTSGVNLVVNGVETPIANVQEIRA